MTRITCMLLGLLISTASVAQNNFRSRQTGDWNQSSTWEEFIAGSFQPTTNTPDFNSGTILIQSPHVVTVTVAVTIDQTTVQANGTLEVAAGIALTNNNGSGADLVVSGELNLLGESFVDGAGDFTLNGILRLGSLNSTGALITGTTAGNIRVSGVRTYSNGARVIYEGTGAQFIGNGHPGNFTSGITSEINNTNGVTFDTNTGSNFSGGGTIYFPGDLILTSGDLNIVSAIGVTRTFYSTAGITANGNNITVAGPGVNILLTGTGDLDFPSPPGLQTVGTLTVIKSGDTVTFPSGLVIITRISSSGDIVLNGTGNIIRDVQITAGSIDFNGSVTITGSITMASATTLSFDGQSLALAGNYTSSGVLSSDASSTLTLTGSTPLTSPLTFTGGSALNTLSMNKLNAGTSAIINSPITLTTALNLSAGILSIVGGNLNISSGATVTRASLGSIATSSPSGGPWNLIYTGTSITTGLEIPASGALTSLAVNINSSAAVTLTQDISVSGAFSVNGAGRTFTSGTNNVAVGTFTNTGIFSAPTAAATTGLTVSGNFVNSNSYIHNSGTLVVAGACVMSGTTIATTNFSGITISGTGSLTAPSTLNMRGNFTNNGAFVAGSNLVVFNGGTSILGGATIATTNFNNVTINNGATVVAGSNFILQGTFAVNGAYTAGTGTTTFAGTTAPSGTNINTTQFNHVQINASSTLTSHSTFLVGGNFTNDGTFTAGATTTVTFSGASSTISGATILTTNFNNITINPGATVIPPTTLNVNGNFTNNGGFTAGSGTVAFGGNSGGKTLSGTTNTQFFALTLNKNNGGTSVSVTSPQTVTSALTLTRGILDVGAVNLTVNSGATVTRNSLGSMTASPAGGPWHLIYLGNTMTSSFEIPASGILTSLTISIDNTRTVNLSQAITVQNALTITTAGRILACGANNVTTNSIVNNGTITAPSSAATTGLTVSAGFTNNGTYTHNNGQVTFNGNTAIAGTSTTNFFRVTITGTLSGSNFNVASNFTNNGVFTAPPLVTFNGIALQTISGSTPTTIFRGIRVLNTFSPTGVTLGSNVNLVDSLSLASNAKFDADGPAGTSVLTLLSTSDAPAVDAKVSRLPAGAVVQGSVTVQRFFRPADNFDRFFSSPVTNATVAMLQAASPAGSFPITGGFPGTSFPCAGCNNDGHNFRYYTESVTGIINKGYTGFIAATTTTLVPGVGYDAYMWNGVSNTTLSLRGPINNNTIALGIVAGPPANSITHTNNGVPSADGWNLVGNPYPSPIQWNNGTGWSKTNIDPTVWVWDVVGRVWHSFNANTSLGDLTNGIIASGQGFWVYAPAVGAASLSVNELAKSFGILGTGSYYRTASAGEGRGSKALRISLTKGESKDNSFLLIDPQATIRFDEGLDAPKLQLGIESVSISMISEGRNLGHMALGNELPEVLPLSMFVEDNGPATISFEVPDSYAALAGYYLVDTYLSRSVLVGSGKPYAFDIIAGDPSSQGERFYLSKYPLVEKSILSTLRLTLYPNPAVDVLHIELNTEQVTEMALLDYAGRPVSRINPVVEDGITRANVDVSQQPTGLYILKVMTEGTMMTQKIVISH